VRVKCRRHGLSHTKLNVIKVYPRGFISNFVYRLPSCLLSPLDCLPRQLNDLLSSDIPRCMTKVPADYLFHKVLILQNFSFLVYVIV
jgi:hypothetical protein